MDADRPGAREGLYNTNNHCEAFFKKLLRIFLGGGGSRSPSAVLNVIVSQCLLFYENTIIQRNNGYQRKKKKTKYKLLSFLKFSADNKKALISDNGKVWEVLMESTNATVSITVSEASVITLPTVKHLFP